MRFGRAALLPSLFSILPHPLTTTAFPTTNQQHPLISNDSPAPTNYTITADIFASLSTLARIVDISYCVGLTGITAPFSCLSHCSSFPTFALITTFNTGPLLSDSCGYIAYDHSPSDPRIIIAFRGTYSIANTIVDLSTIPQEYVPYIGENVTDPSPTTPQACTNCTVHSGFLKSWRNTRSTVTPQIDIALKMHPEYRLELVGHSLGGAVALLAGLEFHARGWSPRITTFGEPKVGNLAFTQHIDDIFSSSGAVRENSDYRRVTHVDDPVPLLPPTEWGYRPHAGEVYITKSGLPPEIEDVRWCDGDDDVRCSAGSDRSLMTKDMVEAEQEMSASGLIPARYKIWQLFFAHRDYFWRLGICMREWEWKGWDSRDAGVTFVEVDEL